MPDPPTKGRMLDAYPKSDWRGMCALVSHLSLLAACTAVAQLTTLAALRCMGLMLQGIVMTFLFCPAHECTHHSAFRSRVLNDIVGFTIGVVLVLPPYWFRCFHVAHHKHTQDPIRDPEIRWSGFRPTDKRKYGPTRLNDRLWNLSGAGYWKERVTTTARYATGSMPESDSLFVYNERMTGRLIREARLFTAIYAAVAAIACGGGFPLLWRHWFLPALIGQPFLRLYLQAEHTGCELVHEWPPATVRTSNPAATLREARRHSRTSAAHILPRLAVRFIFWNMPYHAEHHAFPEIPFHHLPTVSDALSGEADGHEAHDTADAQATPGCVGEGILSAYWRDFVALHRATL